MVKHSEGARGQYCFHVAHGLQSAEEEVMLTPTLLIFEQKPRWVPELERQFVGEDVRVRGCSSLSSLQDRLGESNRCVVILELAADPAECLQTLGRLLTRSPSPTILVVASSEYREWEWPVRELGAVAFCEEPIPGNEMAKWCRRQFRRGQAPFALNTFTQHTSNRRAKGA